MQADRGLLRPICPMDCMSPPHELHIKHMAEAVTGNNKEPGVKLFRRLISELNSLEIDYSKLNKLTTPTVFLGCIGRQKKYLFGPKSTTRREPGPEMTIESCWSSPSSGWGVSWTISPSSFLGQITMLGGLARPFTICNWSCSLANFPWMRRIWRI